MTALPTVVIGAGLGLLLALVGLEAAYQERRAGGHDPLAWLVCVAGVLLALVSVTCALDKLT